MAIAPLQLPGYAAPQSLDFSSLANLGQVYKQANAERGIRDAFANGLPTDAAGLSQLGATVGAYNPQLGLSLAQLGMSAEQRQQDRERQARQDAFQREEAARAQRNADRSFNLQQQQFAENQDYSPQERAAMASQYGIQQGTPEFKAFVLTGKLPDSASKIPAGFESDPSTGGLKPIAGGPADPAYLRTKGDQQNAPSGYRWVNPEKPNEGMVPIPGGPGEKVDAEVAGRLGLARSFLGQLPEIRKRVEAGEITGPIDAGMAKLGMGGPGEIRRQMDSGAEALLRMLTGAGMNMEEAKEYTRRYRFDPTDKSTTVLSKLNQLERELNSVGETVGKGRGGWTPPGAAQTPSGNVTSSGVKWSVQ